MAVDGTMTEVTALDFDTEDCTWVVEVREEEEVCPTRLEM